MRLLAARPPRWLSTGECRHARGYSCMATCCCGCFRGDAHRNTSCEQVISRRERIGPRRKLTESRGEMWRPNCARAALHRRESGPRPDQREASLAVHGHETALPVCVTARADSAQPRSSCTVLRGCVWRNTRRHADKHTRRHLKSTSRLEASITLRLASPRFGRNNVTPDLHKTQLPKRTCSRAPPQTRETMRDTAS